MGLGGEPSRPRIGREYTNDWRAVDVVVCQFTTKLRSEQHKDLEVLLLRQQLRILQRRNPKTLHLSRWGKLGLAILAARFMSFRHDTKTKLNDVLLLFQPYTVLK